jgi:hypothetical protein
MDRTDIARQFHEGSEIIRRGGSRLAGENSPLSPGLKSGMTGAGREVAPLTPSREEMEKGCLRLLFVWPDSLEYGSRRINTAEARSSYRFPPH